MNRLAEELREFRARHPVRRASVDGVEWTYIVGGEGAKTVLYLPGGGGLAEMAFTFLPDLERDFRVIAVNYPPVSSLAQLVAGVLAILDRENTTAAHLWGTSFGGMVAQVLAHTAPNRAATLVLSNTAAPTPRRAKRARRQARIAHWLPVGAARWVLHATFKKQLRSLPAEDRRFWTTYLTQVLPDAKAVLSNLSELSAEFYELRFTPDDPNHWSGPVLILAAEDDELYREMYQRLCQLYANAEVRVFPGGHSASLARDSEYVEVVHEFLVSPRRAAAARAVEHA